MNTIQEEELIRRIEGSEVSMENLMDFELQFKREQEKDKKALQEAWY